MIGKRFLVYLFLFCISVSTVGTSMVYAGVTNDFTVNFFVGTDTTSPTTPVLQSATPVATTQIDLQWLPASDDVFLSGYRVYRDGIIIATTTLTSFNDSGLLASTLYTYQVDAFDSFYNISSSSNALATATLALPIIPPTTTTPPADTSNGSGATRLPLVQEFSIIPERTSAIVAWQTNNKTQYILAWGRTDSYDSGMISSNVFSRIHQTQINDLEPNTKYYFELSAIDTSGIRRVIKADWFITLPAFSSVMPINIQGFGVEVVGSDVSLFWNNGTVPVGAVVRIVRSHLYYPASITDGALVYEGTATGITDAGALLVRTPQFYTAFVITSDKRVSSGAIAVAGRVVQTLSPQPTVTDPLVETGDPNILVAPAISIIQAGKKEFFDNLKPLLITTPYLISIPVTALAPGIKSIIVSVEDHSNQSSVSTYLLKLNKSGDAYEAFIPAPSISGDARISLEVFNYSAENVRQITTTITFIDEDIRVVLFPDVLLKGTTAILPAIYVSGLILIALFLWWLLRSRRREDKH